MADFKYTRSEIKQMKAIGTLDIENMTMTVECEAIEIATLLKDFDKNEITLGIRVKTEEDLELTEE